MWNAACALALVGLVSPVGSFSLAGHLRPYSKVRPSRSTCTFVPTAAVRSSVSGCVSRIRRSSLVAFSQTARRASRFQGLPLQTLLCTDMRAVGLAALCCRYSASWARYHFTPCKRFSKCWLSCFGSRDCCCNHAALSQRHGCMVAWCMTGTSVVEVPGISMLLLSCYDAAVEQRTI